MELVLQILTGDPDALAEAREAADLSDTEWAGVAEHYVLRVILFRDASPHRLLAAESSAPHSEIRRNMGLLLRWLHPDRDASAWRAAFAGRVIEAWRRIDRGEARRESGRQEIRSRGPRPPPRAPWIAVPAADALGPRRGYRGRPRLRLALATLTVIVALAVPDEFASAVGRAVWELPRIALDCGICRAENAGIAAKDAREMPHFRGSER